MFSARSIHFALLGIILGASSGYIFAFYRAQAALPPPNLTETEAQSDVPAGHPDVDNAQMLEAMKKAMEASPEEPELIKRYAMALFDTGQFEEAGKWFGKAVELEPNSVESRSMYGAALWRSGNRNGAVAQLDAALRIDPKNIPSLHGLTLLSFERDDFVRAAELIKRIEAVEPDYSALPGLRSRLQAERGTR
jgi:tetratricopeptide (TPR) repeat protein